jgi:FecR protein/PEGA domain
MTADACTRWASIAGRLALGEPIAAGDASFLRRHAGACDACGEEAHLYMELEGLLAPDQAERTSEESVRPAARRRLGGRVGSRAAGVALFVGAAAALFVYVRGRGETSPTRAHEVAVSASTTPATTPALQAAPSATVTLLEGDATLDAARVTAGTTLVAGATLATSSGRACLRLDPGVRVCLAESTRLRVESLAGPARVLRLEKGRVAAELEPQPPGTTFSIAAGDGSVTAIGTAFSVELTGGAPPVARVSHGVVLVRAANEERRLHAHEAARFGDAVRALPAPEEDADRALLRQALTPETKAPGRLTLDSSPSGAAVRIDDALVGTTPLDVLVPAGAHVVAVAGADKPLAVDVREGEHIAKAFLLAPAPAPAPPRLDAPVVVAPVAPAAPPPESPAALLSTAQAARAHGDPAAAARAYRALLAAHPKSAEASAATLSLADLELARGADESALDLFDRYLAGAGPLALEARYGRIRALTRLGRRAEADAARAAFLHDYAGSPQADALRTTP